MKENTKNGLESTIQMVKEIFDNWGGIEAPFAALWYNSPDGRKNKIFHAMLLVSDEDGSNPLVVIDAEMFPYVMQVMAKRLNADLAIMVLETGTAGIKTDQPKNGKRSVLLYVQDDEATEFWEAVVDEGHRLGDFAKVDRVDHNLPPILPQWGMSNLN